MPRYNLRASSGKFATRGGFLSDKAKRQRRVPGGTSRGGRFAGPIIPRTMGPYSNIGEGVRNRVLGNVSQNRMASRSHWNAVARNRAEGQSVMTSGVRSNIARSKLTRRTRTRAISGSATAKKLAKTRKAGQSARQGMRGGIGRSKALLYGGAALGLIALGIGKGAAKTTRRELRNTGVGPFVSSYGVYSRTRRGV